VSGQASERQQQQPQRHPRDEQRPHAAGFSNRSANDASREGAAVIRVACRVLVAASVALAGASTFAQPAAPTPESVIGWAPCADYKLATYEQIEDYFRKLANAVPSRMQLVEMGKTVEGRTQVLAVVSSEQNLRQLGKYKDIARRLALARASESDARALAREGKAVVWIDFGLHSSEVAHGQTAPLLLHKVVTEESDEMRSIRDNVILLLVANMNPDGTTMVASWYREHRGKPWEDRVPELWHTYVGHDDNRDWFMMNQPETQNSARLLYTEWFPQIIYNQHQSGPFPSRIFVPPFDDPMNPNIPPLVMRGVNLVGDAMTRRLDQEGKRGAVSRIGFDTWWNGGMRTAPYFHNMIGILTETGHSSATPATYDPTTFPKHFANTTVSTLEPSTYYPSPFPGGEWHLRNSCDYMVTTSMALLDIAAKRREEWLYDIYQMGRNAIQDNANETFIVPMASGASQGDTASGASRGDGAQWDPPTAVKMINVLRLGGVEVERARARFEAGGHQYGAGSFLIRGAQAFEPYVRDLLTPQVYPDMRLYPGGPPKRPYDITGWTLNFQMGVKVDRVMERVDVATENVDVAAPPDVSAPAAAGAAFVLDPRPNDSFTIVNRLLKAGDAVFRATAPLTVNSVTWPPGAFLVRSSTGTASRVADAVRSVGIGAASLDEMPREVLLVKPPRIGVYHGWGGNMDEGWTRWLLEQFEFPYARVFDRDVRAGHLHERYDVILLSDASLEQMVSGMPPGTMPDRYTGGMTSTGVMNLYDFVTSGGTLIAMDRAAELPLSAFGLHLENVTASAREADFYVPGSILKIKVDPSHPVAYGMRPDAAAFFANGPAFAVPHSATVRVVAEYPTRNLLMSGWLLGESVIAGRAAVVDATVENGRVILLGFATQHRGQPHGTFKLLFNSILLASSHRVPT
jgi:hypothetical protein